MSIELSEFHKLIENYYDIVTKPEKGLSSTENDLRMNTDTLGVNDFHKIFENYYDIVTKPEKRLLLVLFRDF